jgi:hypothetical protein
MKKMLLVVTLVAFACLTAGAQITRSYTFQDTAHNNYCDGIHLTTFGVVPTYVVGYHDFIDGCGFGFNTPQTGFKAAISLQNNDWARGGGQGTSDASLDYLNGGYIGCELSLFNNIKATGNNGRWEYYYSCNGSTLYVLNEGFLRQGLPPAKVGLGKSSNVSIGSKTVAQIKAGK